MYTLRSWPPNNWYISVDIKNVPSGTLPSVCPLAHFTGGSIRIPVIMLNPNGKFYVQSLLNGNKNGFVFNAQLSSTNYTTLRVEHALQDDNLYYYKVFMNGVLKGIKQNADIRSFENAKVRSANCPFPTKNLDWGRLS